MFVIQRKFNHIQKIAVKHLVSFLIPIQDTKKKKEKNVKKLFHCFVISLPYCLLHFSQTEFHFTRSYYALRHNQVASFCNKCISTYDNSKCLSLYFKNKYTEET